jgi:hypothetical protein
MQWTKWVRKNRQVIMTVVVILLMIVFVGDIGLRQLMSNFGNRGMKQTVGTYDGGQKITRVNLSEALQELEILKNISAEQFLFSRQSPMGMPDINAQLLGYLLFHDTQVGAQLRNQLRQYSLRGQISVGAAEIDEFFSQDMENGDVYWILLSAEARKAGVAVSNQQAAGALRNFVAQITQNKGDAAYAVRRIAAQLNISELQIISTFGKMLAILRWSEYVCDNQNVTLPEIASMIGRMSNRFDVNYASFPAQWFVQPAVPSDDQIKTQFNAYKSFFAGDISDQNPYGFGYKLPQRVQLEYFVVSADEVQLQIQKPTPDDVEEYYSANIEKYRTEEAKEPNNPNGEKITKTRSFAEASNEIYKTLEQERTDKLTQLIFKDARDMMDVEMLNLSIETAAPDQLRQAAADYRMIASKITAKYKIPVLVGQTGLLSQSDFMAAEGLSGLQVQHAGLQTRLSDAVFSVRVTVNDGKPKLGTFSPRVWETIGPMKGYHFSEKAKKAGYITVLCRVVDVKPAGEPETMDVAYNTAGIAFDGAEANQKVFDLKKRIAEDLQKQTAMETARARADEFKQMIAKSNWDAATKEYSAKYAPADPNKVDDKGFKELKPETFAQQALAGQSDIEMMRRMMQDDPSRAQMVRQQLIKNSRNKLFFALLGDKAATGVISEVLEYKPDMAYYVVKEVTLKPATTEDYLNSKGYAAMQAAMTDASAMSLIHFNPSGIQKRLNYVPVNREKLISPGDANQAAK